MQVGVLSVKNAVDDGFSPIIQENLKPEPDGSGLSWCYEGFCFFRFFKE